MSTVIAEVGLEMSANEKKAAKSIDQYQERIPKRTNFHKCPITIIIMRPYIYYEQSCLKLFRFCQETVRDRVECSVRLCFNVLIPSN